MKKLLLCLIVIAAVSYAQENPEYRNTNLPVEKRVEDLLGRMTLEEKIDLLGGTGFATKKIERLGIPELRMTDGPVGARWDKSTAFPVSIAMAASFDPSLVNGIGSAIGRETKGHARHVILGPCVNIARIPNGGRNFESFGEDPVLASRMAEAYIKGVQSENVAATVKHFAVNNQEFERMFVDVWVSNRALNEIYLPAFKTAVTEADALCVMCAYNKINGTFAAGNDYLLDKKLKQEWNFGGLVMSDWGAVHSSLPTALGSLDLEMPFGTFMNEKNLKPALESGALPVSKIDDKVRRILTVIFKLGLFDNPEWKEIPSLINSKENREAAYKTSLASIVLLKNQSNLLPLNISSVKNIAVIGPSAAVAKTGGGGSAYVNAIDPVSPLEGLKSRLPAGVKIHFAKGVDFGEKVEAIPNKYFYTDNSKKHHGLNAEYFKNKNLEGNPALNRTDANIDFQWGGGGPAPELGDDNYSARWSGYIEAPETNEFTISTVSDDGIRVWIDDKLIMEDWTNHAALKTSATVKLEKGKLYKIKMEYYEDGGDAVAILGWKTAGGNMMDEAVQAAKGADLVLMFVGTSNEVETEGADRTDLVLPAGQDELVEKVAGVNKNVVVVLTTGSPVFMDKWIDKVSGVVEMWFGGSEGGNAIADVLLGNYNPSGKLPVTFPEKWEDCSAYDTYKKYDARTYYSDDIYVGYRHFDKYAIDPLFPFGYGLSYTTFEYSNIKAVPNGDGFVITCDVKNTGKVDGAEVAQLYVSCVAPAVDRPVKELKGFAKLELKAGESGTAAFKLTKNDFAYFSEKDNNWVTDPGSYKIMIGASSRDIKLNTNVTINK